MLTKVKGVSAVTSTFVLAEIESIDNVKDAKKFFWSLRRISAQLYLHPDWRTQPSLNSSATDLFDWDMDKWGRFVAHDGLSEAICSMGLRFGLLFECNFWYGSQTNGRQRNGYKFSRWAY